MVIKKGSLGYSLLLVLEKAIEVETSLDDFLANPHSFAWTGYRTNLNYNKTYKAIQQLKKYGYVETRKDGRKILFKLTDEGRQEAIIKKLLEDDSWDGKWRIVIFDIPEKQRKLRHVLRMKLREWQFKPWQKSVWVSKKAIEFELHKFLKEVDLSDWVKVLVAEELIPKS